MVSFSKYLIISTLVVCAAGNAFASGVIRGKVSLAGLSVGSRVHDPGEVLVFIEGLTEPLPAKTQEMVQQNHTFVPALLIVPLGSSVRFPNLDSELHNVFSLSRASSFDLMLYARGTKREVVFDRPGIVPVFCNIHPQMRAHIIVVSNPHYVRPSSDGTFELRGVPPGDYTIAAWHPLAKVTRSEVHVEAGTTTDLKLVVRETQLADHHLNKHGKRYGGY